MVASVIVKMYSYVYKIEKERQMADIIPFRAVRPRADLADRIAALPTTFIIEKRQGRR